MLRTSSCQRHIVKLAVKRNLFNITGTLKDGAVLGAYAEVKHTFPQEVNHPWNLLCNLSCTFTTSISAQIWYDEAADDVDTICSSLIHTQSFLCLPFHSYVCIFVPVFASLIVCCDLPLLKNSLSKRIISFLKRILCTKEASTTSAIFLPCNIFFLSLCCCNFY